MRVVKIAVAQIQSTDDPFENLLLVNSLIEDAQNNGATFICFPENCFYRGPSNDPRRKETFLEFSDSGELLDTSSFSRTIKEFCSGWTIGVSIGSILENNSEKELPYNSHAVFIPPTQSFEIYRKIHLFKFESGQSKYDESATCSSGEKPLSIKFNNWNVGLTICYDLRFPELFRYLSLKNDCGLILAPAAFTTETGKFHWYTLLRARAIENQSYIVASAQWGTHKNSAGQTLSCFGHSVVYDPWGDLLIDLGSTGTCLGYVEISPERLRDIRRKLPALCNAKIGLFK